MGYVYERNKNPADQLPPVREFDARFDGNRNSGHEFGTSLSPDETQALLLDMKVMK